HFCGEIQHGLNGLVVTNHPNLDVLRAMPNHCDRIERVAVRLLYLAQNGVLHSGESLAAEGQRSAAGSRGLNSMTRSTVFAWPVCCSDLFGRPPQECQRLGDHDPEPRNRAANS